MALWSGNEACLWLSQQHMYLLKTETNCIGRIYSRQFCVYTCPKNWQSRWDSMQECLHDVVSVYGLQAYTLYLILSGSSLIWKNLNLATKEKEEARSLIIWDEAIGDGSTTYAFDLARAEKLDEAGVYAWMSAAYPYDIVSHIVTELNQMRCRLRRIDVLPALVSRLCGGAKTGILYICEPSLVHAIRLKSGIPLSYECISSLPQAGQKWLEGEDRSKTAVWLDEENGTWSYPPISDSMMKTMKQWDAAYPEAILLAY